MQFPFSNDIGYIIRFILTVVNGFRRRLSQFSSNSHDILQALFSENVIEKHCIDMTRQ